MSADKYVLAMYDIRGKQSYIYRSNHIKEIIGGSRVIADCYQDYLFPAAVAYRDGISFQEARRSGKPAIFTYLSKDAVNSDFTVAGFEEKMASDQYVGEVVYDGGGNFFVLYKNEEVCVEINKIFTKAVLENTFSLKVLCTYIEIDNFQDYISDRDALYEKHRVFEAKEAPTIPAQVMPFTQVDYRTSMPLYTTAQVAKKPAISKKLTKESYCKYQKYWEIEAANSDLFGEKILDNLVTGKGEDSHLAVIYIDGNNMGEKVQKCLQKADGTACKTYEECVARLRRFSEGIQKNYIDDRMVDIDNAFAKKYGKDYETKKRRFVIYAGDEINFICNARDALMIAHTYLDNLDKVVDGDGVKHNACAGIAVFHSHTPYSEAYRIAEECCESGKTRMKLRGTRDASLVDVHYCQGAIGIDLERIRKKQVGDLISKPWYVTGQKGDNADDVSLEIVMDIAKQLNQLGRSNVKGLAEAAKQSQTKLHMELSRIKAHNPDIKGLFKDIDPDVLRRTLYDVVIMYDLWFYEKKQEEVKVHE
ncbi:MAG: hypothetical protein IJX85_04665 [Lachnospiraceae bacterium]|nr:hypothetical protein [Lachnospiraceae bacterium]